MRTRHITNPFQPWRDVGTWEAPGAMTLRAALTAQGIAEFDRPTVCVVGGEPVLRAEWETLTLGGDDTALFVTVLQGGEGSNPMRVVLMLAVAIAAPYLAPELAGVMGITSEIGIAAVGAGLTVAGTTLVNLLLPPPALPSPQAAASPSPTYSLQAQGNQARLGQPIPVIYGRHMVYPDFGAQPYQEFDADDQYLYQLFVIGQGEYDLEQLRIEDTPISSFDAITYEQVAPGGTVTLFNPHVTTAVEVAGQQLEAPNNGGDWVGPFVANLAGTQATSIGIDVALPQGLVKFPSGGGTASLTVSWIVEGRQINDDGNPVGNWVQLGSEVLTLDQTDPVRRSYSYAVSAGRYEVRARRLNEKDNASGASNTLLWAGLRGYLNDTPTFAGVTVLAMKLLATDNLSAQAARRVNAVVQRKLPIWDSISGTWSAATATRSPAWALADILRASYGAAVDDSRIDLAGLEALATTWGDREDDFDAIYDQRLGTWEALTLAARVGRAVPIRQGGVVRVIRDAPQSVITALFTPRNIVRGSLRLQYVMPGETTADAVTVRYFDAGTWAPAELTVQLEDSSGLNPVSVDLFGATSSAHAEREGMHMALTNRYRRRIATFATELEGHIPLYGDLIGIAHDLPAWGQFGEAVAWTLGTLTLQLDTPMDWSGTGTFYAAIRQRDGSVDGPFAVTQGATAAHLVLGSAPAETPYTGGAEERTHVAFGLGAAWGAQARVLAIRPRGSERVEVVAVIEDDRVNDLGRSGLLSNANQVDYLSASQSQRDTYAFMTNDAGQMSNGDDGYVFGE